MSIGSIVAFVSVAQTGPDSVEKLLLFFLIYSTLVLHLLVKVFNMLLHFSRAHRASANMIMQVSDFTWQCAATRREDPAESEAAMLAAIATAKTG